MPGEGAKHRGCLSFSSFDGDQQPMAGALSPWSPLQRRKEDIASLSSRSSHNFFFIYCFLSLFSLKRRKKTNEKKCDDVIVMDSLTVHHSLSLGNAFNLQHDQAFKVLQGRLIVMCCRLKPKRRNDFHGQESMIHVLTSSFSFCWPFNQPQADGQQ